MRAHPGIKLRNVFGPVKSVDDFLDAALLVPIDLQPSLVELLVSYKGSGRKKGQAAAMGLEKLASKELTVERTQRLTETSGAVKVGASCARALPPARIRGAARASSRGAPPA